MKTFMRRLNDPAARNPLVALLVALVRVYQKYVSPVLPRSCRYYPSCSQYAIDALTQYGLVRGLILTCWRLLRCNPFSYGGYDPVEHQMLFKPRTGARKAKTSSVLVASLLVMMLFSVAVVTTSCSFWPETTTTSAAGSGVATSAGTASTQSTDAGATTTTEKQGSAGFLANTLKPLQAVFFWILEFFHKTLGVSWSWAIVILTVIVRLILLPLTWRQIKSMRAMQALQPQLLALQEKYKNDRQLLNQKTMELYQENKVSPFGSCLPLILQLPVFFGLYYMLRTAGMSGLDPATAGRWAGVFTDPQVGWLWIKDITDFDYGLMFLYIASQFVASWQTARKSAAQQKMIAYLMPIIVGIMMYVGKWPSGLFIYWFTSNLWTIVQQFVAEKLVPVPVVAAAGGAKGGAGKATSGKAVSSKTKPGAAKPGGTKPGAARPGAAKAGAAKPGGTKGSAAKAGTGRGSARSPGPGTKKPGAAKAGAAKPSTGKPGASKPGPAKTGPQPGTAKPGTAKPGATKPASGQAGGAKGNAPATTPGKAVTRQPARQTGGTSGGQQGTKQQGKTTGSQSQRPHGGTGNTKGTG